MDSGRSPRHAAPKRGAPRHARQPAHGRRWRARAVTAAILVLVLVGALALSVHALDQAPQTPPAALLGAWVAGDSSKASSQQAATEQLEAAIGRKLAIGHSFVRWGRDLGSLPAWNLAAGRTPMLSFGRDVSADAVAAGRYDAWLVSLARSVSALGRPLLLRYAWAMDSAVRRDPGRYGPAYVAAWRHVHDLFATQGVRGSWVWAPNADAFAGARGGVDQYWPGDGYVDWIGADGFNRGTCDGGSAWSSFETIFRAFYNWGSAKGKPLMVSETGTVEDAADPSRKSAWYADAASTLARSMPGIRAVVYFDQGGRCDWRPDTSVQSMQGFIRFARDPFFGGTGDQSAATTTTQPATVAPTTTLAPTTTTVRPTTTTQPTTTAPTTTTPQPASKCAAGGGVAIGTADNAQSVVNAHAAGTTYLVKAGTHQNNFSVRPKSGDSFCGEPGAVLDGGRSLQTAFSGGATDVTLDSITVRDYNSGKQGAAIQPESHASGWVVRNVSALHNAWAGLLVADGMKILGGHYNDNDELGIGGNAATGILLDGLDADPTTIDGPEMARNHTLHVPCGWEAGGMKWDFGQVTIRNAYVHDNDCRGLWADINAHDALIEHNLIEHNLAEGIFYEISQDAVIRYNQVYRNGYVANGWYWDAGITVNASFNVEVYGNRLSGNYNGITGVQQDRPDSTPPAHLLDHLQVHDNLICATGGGGHPTGVVADNGANLAARDISFRANTVQSATCQ
jgi:Right handed beta helix region